MNGSRFYKISLILTLVGLVSLQLIVLSNSSFTAWPEMILYPWLMSKGYLLYQDIVNPYFPLLPIVLNNFFKVAGYSANSLVIFTYIVVVISDISLFFTSRRLFGSYKKSLLILTTYIFLQYSYGGNGLWFELSLVPFLICGFTLIYLYPSSKRYLVISGILFGLAGMIKQNAFLFLIPIVAYLILTKNIKSLLYFFVPVIFLLGSLGGYLYLNSLIDDFWRWAIILPLSFTEQPGFVLMPPLRQYPIILFPLLAIVGLLLSKKIQFKNRLYWILILLISLSFAFPRYENFHLQVLAAIASLMAGFLPKKLVIVFCVLSCILFVHSLDKLWQKPDRFIDKETTILAEKIEPLSSIYLLNSPDLAFFFADKLPPKPWAINFPWYFEGNNLSQLVVSDLRNRPFEYVVIADSLGGGKFDLGSYLPEEVTKHISQNYGIVERFNQYNIWKLRR